MASNTTTSVDAVPSGGANSLVVRRTETVAPETRVRHFDELSEEAQTLLAKFDGEESVVPITQSLADDINSDTTVVFIDYYRLTLA
ncbi:hypothetical protein ACFFQF_11415 [Haladaptatus pallidirubidus]|uniref:DUF7979 domain-containing protein n=1 Tax=Haladaptatus pallidirubidus TaxID=1008152 RepID=A0AAV3UEN9_9EURY|nr:hypothetical protein [Haladaptatus pallidirubidus]